MLDHRRSLPTVVASAVFVILAFTTFLLRMWTRFFVLRSPGLEDYLIMVAMLCSIALTVTIGEQAKYGMGNHIWDIDPGTLKSCLKAFWASLSVYNLSLGFTKASVLLQYYRLFPLRGFRITCCVVLGMIVTYSIWTVFGSIFACRPIALFWNKSLKGTCIDEYSMWFTNAGINIATDFVIIILPMPVLSKLNLPRPQKRALIIVFALGGFVCLVSILRLYSLVSISNSPDPTYDNPPAAAWSSVEASVIIVCSCLSTLRPLLSKYLPMFNSSTQGSKSRRFRSRDYIESHRLSLGAEVKIKGASLLPNFKTKGPHHSDDIAVVTVVEQQYEY